MLKPTLIRICATAEDVMYPDPGMKSCADNTMNPDSGVKSFADPSLR